MSKRNELAEKILLQLLTQDAPSDGPEADVEMAFCLADAFLAACGPDQEPEREPDAVWTLTAMEQRPTPRLAFDDRYGIALAPELGNRILAGRDRVRLRVFVEEVEA